MKLLRTLSIVSRRRWPDFADASVKVGVPPPKKKAAAGALSRSLDRSDSSERMSPASALEPLHREQRGSAGLRRAATVRQRAAGRPRK